MKKYKPSAIEAAALEALRTKNFTELDRKGPPKALRQGKNFRTENHFYKLFDWFGAQYKTRVQLN